MGQWIFFWCASLGLQFFLGLVFAPKLIQVTRAEITTTDVLTFTIYWLSFLVVGFWLRFLAAKYLLRFCSIDWRKRVLIGVEFFSALYLAISFSAFLRFGLHLDHPLVLPAIRLTLRETITRFFAAGMTSLPEVRDIPIQLADLIQLGGLILAIALCVWVNAIYSKKVPSDWGERVVGRAKVYSSALILCALLLPFLSTDDALATEAVPFSGLATSLFGQVPNVFVHYDDAGVEKLKFNSKPNILIFQAESFRWDQIDEGLTPNLFNLAKSEHCLESTRNYAGGHITAYGSFSLLYGLNSSHYIGFTRQKRPSPAIKAIRSNGYRSVALDASGLQEYLVPSLQKSDFDEYKEFLTPSETGRADREMIDELKLELSRAGPHPLFAFSFFFSSHAPYTYPPPFALDAPTKPVNRYRNSVRYIDSLIGEIAESQKNRQTILVFTGDHGEEFGEHGSEGHVGVRFEDVRTRTPLMICFFGDSAPKKKTIQLSTASDVMPTILDWLSGDQFHTVAARFDGMSFFRKDRDQTKIAFISGAWFPIESRQFAFGKITTKGFRKYQAHLTGVELTEFKIERILDGEDVSIPASSEEWGLANETRDELLKQFRVFSTL